MGLQLQWATWKSVINKSKDTSSRWVWNRKSSSFSKFRSISHLCNPWWCEFEMLGLQCFWPTWNRFINTTNNSSNSWFGNWKNSRFSTFRYTPHMLTPCCSEFELLGLQWLWPTWNRLNNSAKHTSRSSFVNWKNSSVSTLSNTCQRLQPKAAG